MDANAANNRPDVPRLQPDHQVHVIGRPPVAVRDHGQPADDEVTHPARVQVADGGFRGGEFQDSIAGTNKPKPKCAP